jgi:hypothetical protein
MALDQLFLFERKSYKKRQKPLQDLSALSVLLIIRKSAPLPARDVCSFLANIRRNREARERFTNFLLSANALYARMVLIMVAHCFVGSKKFIYRFNSPWFRAIFAPAKMGHGEAKELFAKGRTDRR